MYMFKDPLQISTVLDAAVGRVPLARPTIWRKKNQSILCTKLLGHVSWPGVQTASGWSLMLCAQKLAQSLSSCQGMTSSRESDDD